MKKVMSTLRILLHNVASLLTIIPFLISLGQSDVDISKVIVGRHFSDFEINKVK